VPLVLDTGPIVALLDRADPAHHRCTALLADSREALVIPAPVLVEVDYWARTRLGLAAWRTLVEDIAAGAYEVVWLDADELHSTARLEEQYADLGLGFVDASVVAVCERLDERRVVTLDHRDLGVVSPRHCDHLELLPP
jgi:uncharacterized protein